MTITDEKFVALTTYRQNGDSSSTAVWIVDLGDGTTGFTTPIGSLKVKRIRSLWIEPGEVGFAALPKRGEGFLIRRSTD